MKTTNKFVRYMTKTYKNKLAALAIIAVGILSLVLDHDATLLVFGTIFAIPLFLTKKTNWFYKPKN